MFDHIIKRFQTHGIEVLRPLTLKQLTEILDEAQKSYYNHAESVLMTDDEYDIIKEYTETHFPSYRAPIGAKVASSAKKVNLPFPMPSMNKIKPDTNVLSQWTRNYCGPYVISAKLDGISGLFCFNDANKTSRLYTRGDGCVGQDISHLIPYLMQLPTSESSSIAIRGELIMKRHTFDEKYSGRFANSRNMVAGCVNQKNPDSSVVANVDFIAYEVIEPKNLTAIQQMELLQNLGVKTVRHLVLNSINNSVLSNILVDWRNNYEYATDGIIVSNNAVVFDDIVRRTNTNPEHSFAFKMVLSEQIAEAKVIDVLWSPSKYGLLKPRVQIEPVVLGGVTIEYATAFHAAYVQKNKIGVGAVIQLMRSGDVIPHILSVIKPATHAKMPLMAYGWNKTGIDIVLINSIENETVQQKNIVSFFQALGVEGLGEGNVKKIMDAGFTSVADIMEMTPRHFLRVEGFKDKMANKIHASIQTHVKEGATLEKVMAASGVFDRGFGEKRVAMILEGYPDVLMEALEPAVKIEKIRRIRGIELITAQQFVAGIVPFLEFLKECRLEHLLSHASSSSSLGKTSDHVLFGKSVVVTGFRDKELTTALNNVGAKEVGSISKNTFALVVKDKDFISVKVDTAKEKGVAIYSLDEFRERFL